MLYGIFVESNTDLGLLYKSYKDIPKRVKTFMHFINDTIDYAQNRGVPNDDIESELNKFKSDVKMFMLKEENADINNVSSIIKDIKNIKEDVQELMGYLGHMRKKFRFGENLVKGIIIKPKIYTNSIKDEDHIRVNKYMRTAGKSLDWIEKVIIDLLNLCDQDLNLLSVMDKLYFRDLHESSDYMIEFDDYCDEVDDIPISVDVPESKESLSESSESMNFLQSWLEMNIKRSEE